MFFKNYDQSSSIPAPSDLFHVKVDRYTLPHITARLGIPLITTETIGEATISFFLGFPCIEGLKLDHSCAQKLCPCL
jgi:hypothetical protein